MGDAAGAWAARRGLLVGLLVAGLALTGCGRGRAPSAASTTTTAPRVTTSTGPGVTTSTTTGSTAPPTTTPTGPAGASLGGYQPLFPFATPADVETWRRSYEAGGHDPWHLDSGLVAVAFAGWLGYPQIDTVTGSRTDRTGAHVAVGFRTGETGDRTSTAAVVHLVRWGSAPDAPWEVVGTDDTTFTVTAPRYGAAVASPVRVGGRISGVDESIRVEVRSALSSSVVGSACCLPAGGDATPWSETVSFAAPAGSLLVIAAQTGGHVAAVERFAVTAVRAR